MENIAKVKIGIVAVSRDCFPESLSVDRRKALIAAYKAKYNAEDIYECPICPGICGISATAIAPPGTAATARSRALTSFPA